MVVVSTKSFGGCVEFGSIDYDAVIVYRYFGSEFRKFFRHGGGSVAFFYFKTSCSGKSSAVFCRRNRKKNWAKVGAIGNIDILFAFFKKGKIFFINLVALKAFGFKTGHFNFGTENVKGLEKCGVGIIAFNLCVNCFIVLSALDKKGVFVLPFNFNAEGCKSFDGKVYVRTAFNRGKKFYKAVFFKKRKNKKKSGNKLTAYIAGDFKSSAFKFSGNGDFICGSFKRNSCFLKIFS